MWNSVARIILRYGYVWLIILLGITAFLGWHASKVKLSYEFSRAIPTDNPKYEEYEEFRRKFGDDGNLLVIGIQTKEFFTQKLFNDYNSLQKEIKKVKAVESIISVPSAINLVRTETENFKAVPIFRDTVLSQAEIDSGGNTFLNLPFYRNLLYNPSTNAWLMGVSISPAVLNSPARTKVVNDIVALTKKFGTAHDLDVHLSGLPFIRTQMADRIQKEMRLFLIGSVLLSAIILLLFFRSISATLLSLAVVIIGVIWSLGIMDLFGYKITLLTALIPPLIVVIGIPNCIYFLNKYHSSYKQTNNKEQALMSMISKMGVVTLFCNIAAAIGFAVFALTKSVLLKEFGEVAGINIMLLFFISLILIPFTLKSLPVPKARHTKYLYNPRILRWLDRLEYWSLNHRKTIFGVTAVVLIVSILGILRLKSVGYIVDDLPTTDKLYTDLKFFENNFNGVMPLEIVIDTKQKNGIRKNMLKTINGMDSLSQYLVSKPYIAKPLSIVEGLKFAKQAFFEGDSSYYLVPEDNDLLALRSYLSPSGDSSASKTSFSKLVASFMDSSKQQARISVNMKDVGSARLPYILDSIQTRANQIFPDTNKYKVLLTGSSVTFLEGTSYIISGLKQSILWAFLLIALCMLYLFRSGKILLCSLLPNVIPLVITAGVMGWVGVALKPSTVLVFSVALGIAIDITIRFLVNFKQQSSKEADAKITVVETIHSTGVSIIYTSIVLIAGFVIFCFSGFGGTKALGWLTSLTLVTATVANLVLLPALIIGFYNNNKKQIKP
ncbi:MAG: efflux RND transporter permease subunit [Flavisolibacter sp.]